MSSIAKEMQKTLMEAAQRKVQDQQNQAEVSRLSATMFVLIRNYAPNPDVGAMSCVTCLAGICAAPLGASSEDDVAASRARLLLHVGSAFDAQLDGMRAQHNAQLAAKLGEAETPPLAS